MEKMEKETGNIRELIRNRKMQLAERDGTVVVWGRTSDTRIAYSLLNGIDLAMKRLRDGMGFRYKIEATADAINKYNALLKEMAEFAEEVCEATNVELRIPKSFRESLGIKSVDEDVQVEKKEV